MATEVGWIRRRWPGFRRRSAEARSCCGVSCVPPWRGGSSRVWPPRGLQSQGTCRASPDTRLEWLRRQGVCRGLGDSLFWSSVSGARSWAMVLLPSPLKAQKAMAAVPGHRGGVPGREVDLAPVGTQGLDETVAAPFERWRPVGLLHHLEFKGDGVLGLCRGMAQQSPESGEGTMGDAHGQRADAKHLAWRWSGHAGTVECPPLARQPWGAVLRSELPSVSMALADQRGSRSTAGGLPRSRRGRARAMQALFRRRAKRSGLADGAGVRISRVGSCSVRGAFPRRRSCLATVRRPGGFRVWVLGFGEWLVVRGGGRLAPYAKVS